MVARFDGDVSLERLTALLDYFEAAGAISGKNTYRQLRNHLEKAAEAPEAYREQIQAFANQTADKAPTFVTAAAADALIAEGNRLLNNDG
jgi:hypothetical protein